MTAHIGLLTIRLHLPLTHSLKEKRRVVNRVKARVKSKFNVSISEIDSLEKWQIAQMGIASVGNNRKMLEKSLREVSRFIDAVILGEGEVIDENITYF